MANSKKNEWGLTQLQEKCAQAQVFLDGMDIKAAVERVCNISSKDNVYHMVSRLKSSKAYQNRISDLLRQNNINSSEDDVVRAYVRGELEKISKDPSEPGNTRVRALELLGKSVKMFTDVKEIQNNKPKQMLRDAIENYNKQKDCKEEPNIIKFPNNDEEEEDGKQEVCN